MATRLLGMAAVTSWVHSLRSCFLGFSVFGTAGGFGFTLPGGSSGGLGGPGGGVRVAGLAGLPLPLRGLVVVPAPACASDTDDDDTDDDDDDTDDTDDDDAVATCVRRHR